MKNKEADRIVAEYMGWLDIRQITPKCSVSGVDPVDGVIRDLPKYHRFLDKLIPVWEKMIALPDYENRIDKDRKICTWSCRVSIEHKKTFFHDAKTMQEASCIATAQAILIKQEVQK